LVSAETKRSLYHTPIPILYTRTCKNDGSSKPPQRND